MALHYFNCVFGGLIMNFQNFLFLLRLFFLYLAIANSMRHCLQMDNKAYRSSGAKMLLGNMYSICIWTIFLH